MHEYQEMIYSVNAGTKSRKKEIETSTYRCDNSISSDSAIC